MYLEKNNKHLKTVLNMWGGGKSKIGQEATIQLLESGGRVLCIGLKCGGYKNTCKNNTRST